MIWLMLTMACSIVPGERSHHRPAGATDSDTPADDTVVAPEPEPNPCPCAADYDADAVEWIDADPHLGAVYGSPTRDELVVFMHGSGQKPDNHNNVVATAAYAGFRVLAVKSKSNPKPLEDCFEDYGDQYDACVNSMSRARIYGSEYPDFSEVEDDDSVVARIHEALVSIDGLQPEGGWDAYFVPLTEDAIDHEHFIRWDQIIISGFSQGTQKAALMALEQRMDGVVIMSGPPDDASWVGAGETPICAWWVMHHTEESWVDYHADNYDILGLEPSDTPILPLPTEVCGDAWPPYDGMHRFSSSLEAHEDCSSKGPHGSMANDVCMNTSDGLHGDPYALFRPYLYAYCAAGSVDADPVTRECNPI